MKKQLDLFSAQEQQKPKKSLKSKVKKSTQVALEDTPKSRSNAGSSEKNLPTATSLDLKISNAKNLKSKTLNQENLETKKIETPKTLSVSELNSLIRGEIEHNFSQIWVKGEISNFKAHRSGHFYFSLKDDKSQINALMFKGFNSHLKFHPKDGMEVLAQGKVTVYEPRGQYQIFCQRLEPLGAGALQLAFEQLKVKLKKEGLFDESRKIPLPNFPKHIALVTSPTGAAVKDIIQVLQRRCKALRITVIPALVQGDSAPASIAKGLRQANKISTVDLIIVGRGGGSIEDLWGFNDEVVARSISDSIKPIISAIGHEVDFTIADFVADLRAPTPSAAAELAIKNQTEILQNLQTNQKRLWQAQKNYLSAKKMKIQSLRELIINPSQRLVQINQRLDELTSRLESSTKRLIQIKLTKLQSLDSLLNSLKPLEVLQRGFALVKSSKNKLVSSAKSLRIGELINIRLSQGSIVAKVESVTLKSTSIKKK